MWNHFDSWTIWLLATNWEISSFVQPKYSKAHSTPRLALVKPQTLQLSMLQVVTIGTKNNNICKSKMNESKEIKTRKKMCSVHRRKDMCYFWKLWVVVLEKNEWFVAVRKGTSLEKNIGGGSRVVCRWNLDEILWWIKNGIWTCMEWWMHKVMVIHMKWKWGWQLTRDNNISTRGWENKYNIDSGVENKSR